MCECVCLSQKIFGLNATKGAYLRISKGSHNGEAQKPTNVVIFHRFSIILFAYKFYKLFVACDFCCCCAYLVTKNKRNYSSKSIEWLYDQERRKNSNNGDSHTRTNGHRKVRVCHKNNISNSDWLQALQIFQFGAHLCCTHSHT